MTRSVILFQCQLAVLIMTAAPAQAQTNLLSDPGFEAGPVDGAWTNFAWKSGEDFGGVFESLGAGAHSGANVMRIYAFAASDHALHQDWIATAGKVYVTDGWMRSPPGTNYFTPVNGFVCMIMKFFNASGTELVSIDTAHIGASAPTNWTLYSTGPTLAPAGTVSGQTYCIYVSLGDATTQGAIYFDDLRTATTTASRAGAIANPGFEDKPTGAGLTDIPFWTGDGNAGAVVTNYAKTGSYSLQIYFTETLVEQMWSATQRTKYATAANLFTPSGALKFQSSGTAHGVVLLEFFDAQTNQLIVYESPYFTPQSPSNQWTSLEAIGTAPSGTVFGKTLVGIVGSTNGFGGSVFFDDVTQRVVSTTGTVAGLLHNGGFDDGPYGNAYDLDAAGDFFGWNWLGGTNAGFVAREAKTNGEQSLVVTFPENLVAQGFAATTGATYLLEGSLYTPPGSNELVGTAYGVLMLQFLSGTAVLSQAESVHFDASSPTGTWQRFVAAGQAPGSGSITGRVLAALLGSSNGFGGVLFFDALSLQQTGPLTAYQLWQYEQFGGTDVAGTAANQDYDGDGFNNGGEFIAGTSATSTSSYFHADSETHSSNEVVITWPSVEGRVYALSRLTNLVAGSEQVVITGVVATPPQNAYTDVPPGVPWSFYKLRVGTN